METPALTISRLGSSDRLLGAEALAALPGQVPDIAKLIPGRAGSAVRLQSLLQAVGAQSAAYVTLQAADGFSASVPLGAVIDQGLVVYGIDGGPLSEAEGGPIRFYIIDVEACGIADVDKCANVKHVTRIHLSAEPGFDNRPATLRAHEALHEQPSL